MNYKHFNYISRVLCAILALILLFAFCSCDTEEEYYDINNYSEDVEFCEAEKFMPNLNELGEYIDIEYLCTKNFAFFPEHTIKLIVKYSSEDYAKENGYKFEYLATDTVRDMISCLSFEVDREKEYAPIKNPDGIDSVISARELMTKNGFIV